MRRIQCRFKCRRQSAEYRVHFLQQIRLQQGAQSPTALSCQTELFGSDDTNRFSGMQCSKPLTPYSDVTVSITRVWIPKSRKRWIDNIAYYGRIKQSLAQSITGSFGPFHNRTQTTTTSQKKRLRMMMVEKHLKLITSKSSARNKNTTYVTPQIATTTNLSFRNDFAIARQCQAHDPMSWIFPRQAAPMECHLQQLHTSSHWYRSQRPCRTGSGSLSTGIEHDLEPCRWQYLDNVAVDSSFPLSKSDSTTRTLDTRPWYENSWCVTMIGCNQHESNETVDVNECSSNESRYEPLKNLKTRSSARKHRTCFEMTNRCPKRK